MEIRVKYIKKNAFEGYYAVQVKGLIFWKTIYKDTILANVEKVIDSLAKIDDINSKVKSSNKIVYDGWGVRNIYKTGTSYSINFFESYPIKRKINDKSQTAQIIWEGRDNILPKMEIKTKSLFGKECLEPMKLRITIEKK